MSVRLITGDCRDVLRTLPAESVHCVVTSPPYWGLRDYGVDGQLGLEATFGAYIETMVEVFAEVRRVLRSDGTLWLNLGDSYATSAGAVGGCPGGGDQGERFLRQGHINTQPNRMPQVGLKPKDLTGIPWRVAFALQADGWWLRQDIIWAKPNPMPESIGDRCTKSHEYLFLLAKSERYSFDAAAIAEPAGWDPASAKTPDGWDTTAGEGGHGSFRRGGREKGHTGYVHKSEVRRAKDVEAAAVPVNSRPHSLSKFEADNERTYSRRNKRSVWTVATAPFSEAHFATFPPALIEPCILAGCPEGGTVLDPFGGAGTTALVADRLKRNAILIELNPAYVAMAERRIHADGPLLAQVSA